VTDAQKILKKTKFWRDWACLLTLLLVALAIGAFLLPPMPRSGEFVRGVLLGTSTIVGALCWSLMMHAFWRVRMKAISAPVSSRIG
jgi:hypothetical protein